MAGSSRRHRERPSQRPPSPGDLTPHATLREVADTEKPYKKTCRASSSTSNATSDHDVWADLLDSLLHQIIDLFVSFHDLLAFVGTCRSWRAAFSALPPAFNLSFPPLHLQPNTDYLHLSRVYIKYSLVSKFKWRLIDPAKRTSSFRCSVPQNLRSHMCYLGCSYGYVIFSNMTHCLLVDAYGGTNVRPPKLKSARPHEIYYGTLVAPLNSPNSQLLLWTESSLFQWQVGTNSWLEHPLHGEQILQTVLFKGEMFAMDFRERLHTIRLSPHLSMQEVADVRRDDMFVGMSFKPWLVVCGDMLLLVHLSGRYDPLYGFSGTFKAFRLDFPVKPAKWVRMDSLGSIALFVSFDRRNPTFCCMNPERWGGKSNRIYFASPSKDSDEAWTVVEFGQVVHGIRLQSASVHCDHLQNLWVLPSLVYGVGQ
ncbi:hypothetical protein ACP70R_042158 [Stipagrostis hirtigluma subsp. patula]